MLPIQTSHVLKSVGYTLLVDYIVGVNEGGVVQLHWMHTDAQPTEQQINDWATDVAPLPSGQLFSEWQAENGGNATLTAKRLARDIVDESTGQGILTRAILEVVKDELNILRAEHALATRTSIQVKHAILAKISAE